MKPFHFSYYLADDHTNPTSGIRTADALTRLGVKLPAEVVRARKEADALDLRKKAIHRTDAAEALETQVLEALHLKSEADIRELLVARSIVEVEQAAVAKAAHLARHRHGLALRSSADALIAALADGPFADAVSAITAANAVGSSDIEALAEQGRTAEIDTVIGARKALAVIRHVQTLRLQLARVVGTGSNAIGANKAFDPFGRLVDWRHPDRCVEDGNDLASYMANISAGAEPWLASPTAMAERKAGLDAEYARQNPERAFADEFKLRYGSGVVR